MNTDFASDSLQRRVMPMATVVALHVLLLIALTVGWKHDAVRAEPRPIQASLIQEATRTEPPLPPQVTLERPRIDIDVPLPDVPADARPPDAANQIQAQPSPPPTPAVSPLPITPPRFDAAYLNNPAPTYPPISRRLHEHGVVLLRVLVTTDGHPGEVLIEHTSGSSRLDSAAVNAVQQWKFVPARRGAEAAEAWVLVPLQFELSMGST